MLVGTRMQFIFIDSNKTLNSSYFPWPDMEFSKAVFLSLYFWKYNQDDPKLTSLVLN